ncbi:ATP-binding protein [Paenarthrobacter sp. NPDC089322]|uniref:sensor histidine kinase n=1 Tax=Paenarthrobacter sp. NPDC089322 TaxID=3155065 RepID=UPI0034269270
MSEQAFIRTAARFFRKLQPRVRVAVCELPLALVVAAVAVAAPAVWPALVQNWLFLTGVLLHGLLFLSCFLVPWERLAPNATMAIPILDLVALAFLRTGAYDVLPGLGIIALFPVIWLSASNLLPRASLILSFVGPLFIAFPPFLVHFPNPNSSDIFAVAISPIAMLVVAVAIRLASSSGRIQQARVRQRDQALRQLLAASRDREKLLETILDTIDVGIVAVDSSGENLLTNSQQKEFLRLSEGNLLFGQDRHTPLSDEKSPLQRAINGETFSDYLVWLGAETGQRAISTAASSMRNDADGAFGGAVIVFRDVTDVVEALAAKDELVANVSHEFGSPLTSILGNLDLALRGSQEVPPGLRSRLEVAERNAERLRALMDDLLSSAAAVDSIHLRRTDVAGLVENSLVSAHAQADVANVGLVADVPSPLWAEADPLRLGQALDNLVSNAIKYSPGGGRVMVRAARNNGWIRLEVQDTGIGMTAEETAKIFTRFFRTGAARQAAIPGVGLGLSITKSIVERHGGHITCSSKPGQGSTFTLLLPALQATESAD